jgi:hypothetical protein
MEPCGTFGIIGKPSTRQCASSSSQNFGIFGANIVKFSLPFVIEN